MGSRDGVIHIKKQQCQGSESITLVGWLMVLGAPRGSSAILARLPSRIL